jgi:ATP-dependent DNA helicase RecG
MNEEQLRALWREPEGERVEWKPSLSQTHRIYETICAFANDLAGRREAGVLFIGRNDDGSCSHTAIDDALLRDFLDRLRTRGSILPVPEVSTQQLTLEGCPVLAIIVSPSLSTPVQYNRAVTVRVGASNRRAEPGEIMTLTRRRVARTFDASPANGATMGDLDLFYLQARFIPMAIREDVLEENHRSLEEQLAGLRILDAEFRPTYLGLLVAAKDVRRFLPGAYIDFVRFDGDSELHPILDNEQISGKIEDVLSRTLDKVKVNIRTFSRVDDNGIRCDYQDYPFRALRELIINAVAHRDYEISNSSTQIRWFSDRVEITNPGGPYGRVNERNFGKPGARDYRNPEVMDILRYLGFVERLGIGIPLAQRLLLENGNPEVQFEPVENFLHAVVSSRQGGT